MFEQIIPNLVNSIKILDNSLFGVLRICFKFSLVKLFNSTSTGKRPINSLFIPYELILSFVIVVSLDGSLVRLKPILEISP